MDKQINGFLYVKVEKGKYGTVQAGITEQKAPKEHLRPFVYKPAPITPGLWFHNKNGITFNLLVDYFAIMYQRGEDEQHLINELQKNMR